LPADWQTRLRTRLLRAPDHADTSGLTTLQAAAVLVPIVGHAHAPSVLLTQRAGHLRRHAGQISFPGGRMELRDADLAAAALRETEEETGIGTDFIEPLGFLPDHVVRTGYRVTPLVALLRPGFALRPDTTEVEQVFELPLAFVVDVGNYQARRRVLQGVEVESADLPYGAHNIWGATAAILARLRDLICGERR